MRGNRDNEKCDNKLEWDLRMGEGIDKNDPRIVK